MPEGTALIHRLVTKVLENPGAENIFDGICENELQIIKTNFDDYIMYIWMHLGDTRFNRSGYRTATDILNKKLSTIRRAHAN